MKLKDIPKLTKANYELIDDLLRQHIHRVEDAIVAGDFIIEPMLADLRDNAIATRIKVQKELCDIVEAEKKNDRS